MSNAGYDQSEPNAPVVSIAILLTGLLLTGVFVWGLYYYKSVITQSLKHSELGPTMVWADNYREKQSKELNALEWTNESKKSVKIPIDTAMILTVEDYNK